VTGGALISLAVHMILTITMVFAWNMGVAGAAAANVLSRILQVHTYAYTPLHTYAYTRLLHAAANVLSRILQVHTYAYILISIYRWHLC
jgi:Na+-driven multidrug efflux pump